MRGNKIIILPILAALIIANMAAISIVRAAAPPPEYLYVDGFDATYVDWTPVGASPYLNAPDDGSYITGTEYCALMGHFTFEDIAPLPEDAAIDKVWLEGYTDGPYDEGVDFDVYNAGFDWLGSLYANGAPEWVRMRWIAPDQPTSDNDPSLLTESGLNDFKVVIHFYDTTGAGPAAGIIDAIRLYVTYKEKPPPPIPFIMVNPQVNTAELGGTFAVEIMIPPAPYTPVYDLYGYEFKLAFDPDVLTPVDQDPIEPGIQPFTLGSFFPPNAVVWMNMGDDVEGFAWYSVTMPFGAPKGVSGSGVLAVITFNVESIPDSTLDLYGTMMGNRYGLPIYHLVKDGAFEIIPPTGENFAVCIKTAHREHRRFIISQDEDGFQTLGAMIKNYGDTTYTYVEFIIFDGMGAPVGKPIRTETVAITPNEMTTLEAKWKPPSAAADYAVEARVKYMDNTGAVLIGRKGDPSGAKDLMTVYFRVEP